LGEVELGRRQHDAMDAEIVSRLLEQMRGLQQRLGGDAADIEAGAAERGAIFDHRHLHAELRGADCRHIAARTGADYDEIKGLTHFPSPRAKPRGLLLLRHMKRSLHSASLRSG